jgi:prophage regulatory protein
MKFVSFHRLKADHGIPYSRMHIDRLEKAGKFPKRVKIGAHSVAWVEAEILAWSKPRVAERDASSAAA